MLAEGGNPKDLQVNVPYGRWDIEHAYSPLPRIDIMTMYTRFGAFMLAVEYFDAQAFDIARNEAIAMDPQQRLLLEEVGTACNLASSALRQPLTTFAGSNRDDLMYMSRQRLPCVYLIAQNHSSRLLKLMKW